ncbi:MAG: response regulator transcription factor, partial [Pseudonocardia sp.]
TSRPVPPAGRLGPLTPRQTEIAALVAAGHSNSEIARRLGLAVGTVERHLANTYRSAGLRSRAQLAAWVTARRQPPGPG